MNTPDYDNPELEEQWCEEQRAVVEAYLKAQGVNHGEIGEWPAWHVAPYVAVWAIESLARPGWIGWWAISGDLPTGAISANEVTPPQHPRKAMEVFARKWLAYAEGTGDSDISIGSPEERATLAPLLKSRAETLLQWSKDEAIWAED